MLKITLPHANPRFAFVSTLSVVGALMISCTPSPAGAVSCSITNLCEMTTRTEAAKTNSKITSMQNSVTTAVNSAKTAIVNAIGSSTSGITGSLSQNAAKISNEAADLDRENNIRREKQTRASFLPDDDCGNTAAAQGPASGGMLSTRRASGSRSGYKPDPSNVDDRLIRAMRASGQTKEKDVPPVSPEIHASNLGAGACKTFADPDSVRGKLCAAAGMTKEKPTSYIDADVQAASLFDGPQKEGQTVKNLSLPPEGAERDARAAYLTMVNNPSPPGSPRTVTLKTPEGIAYMGQRSAYEAALSLAVYPLEEWDRLTTANQNESKIALDAIKKSDQKFLNDYFSKSAEGAQKQADELGVSPLMLMDIEVERRIGNPDWLKRMAKATAEEKAAEQLMIDAYSLRLQRDLYIAQLQTNVLLGKLLQNSIVEQYGEKLNSSRQSLEAGVR